MDATFIWKLTKLGRIGSSRLRFDDDFADRLNYQFTAVLMFLFIGLIGIRQYVGKPIQCWVPQSFSRGWEEYAENFCWIASTYFASLNNTLPPQEERQNFQVGYYQWVPVILAMQALLIYMPCMVWRLMVSHSGFNVRRILQMACDSNLLLPEHTLKNVRFIARYMEGCIYRQRDYKKHIYQQQALASAMASHYSTPGNPPPHYSSKTKPTPPVRKSQVNNNSLETQPLTGGYTEPLRGGSFIDRFRSRFGQQPDTMAISRGRPQPITGGVQVKGKIPPSPTDSKNGSTNNGVPHATRNGHAPRPLSRAGPPREKHKCSLVCCGKRYGNFLTVLYFSIKLLYIINIIGQLFLMEKFVGANYSFYGVNMLVDLLTGTHWERSGNFPRVTFCDFDAKKLGQNDRYTLQCVLPLNMFLEKIFIFLWFWHVAIGLITVGSFFSWFYRMGFAKRRVKFVRKYLKIMCVMRETDKATTRKFVENYLRPDGVFILRLISLNVGDFIAGDLACELWHIYRHKRLQNLEEIKFLEGEYLSGAGLPSGMDLGGKISPPIAIPPPMSPGGGKITNNNSNNNNNHDDSIV